MSRAAGVTAAATASSMSSWPSGCSTVAEGRRPTFDCPRAGSRKDHAGREAEPEQRGGGPPARYGAVVVQAAHVVLDVVAGDLPEVVIARRPVQQRGQRFAQVAVDGGDAPGAAAGAAVFEGAQPALGPSRRIPAVTPPSLTVQPGVEGVAAGRRPACPPGGGPRRRARRTGAVPSARGSTRDQATSWPSWWPVQRGGQSLADPAPDLAGPPAGLGEAVGDADRGGQGTGLAGWRAGPGGHAAPAVPAEPRRFPGAGPCAGGAARLPPARLPCAVPSGPKNSW